MRTRRSVAGMTLVEAILSLAIFSSVLMSLGLVLRWREANTLEMEEAALSVDLHEALAAMTSELSLSGFTPDGVYPHLFEDGVPGDDFAAHAHAAPEAPLSIGVTPSRDVVFVLPDDADEDGVPDLDADGSLIWATEERSVVIVPDADGMNRVELRIDGARSRVIARHAESLVVDDSSAVGVPLGCLRLRLALSRSVGGRRLSAAAERTVRLLNGGARP
jgi:hypothetical protein